MDLLYQEKTAGEGEQCHYQGPGCLQCPRSVSHIFRNKAARIVLDSGLFAQSGSDRRVVRPGSPFCARYAFYEAIRREIARTDAVDINALDEAQKGLCDLYLLKVLDPALRHGDCCLYDLKNKCQVDHFIYRSVGEQWGPMAGHGRHEYMLPGGEVFLIATFRS
jgi:hypothetical protein